jgi:hypothetical protein
MLEPSAIIAFFRMNGQTYDFILRSNFLGGLIIGEEFNHHALLWQLL